MAVGHSFDLRPVTFTIDQYRACDGVQSRPQALLPAVWWSFVHGSGSTTIVLLSGVNHTKHLNCSSASSSVLSCRSRSCAGARYSVGAGAGQSGTKRAERPKLFLPCTNTILLISNILRNSIGRTRSGYLWEEEEKKKRNQLAKVWCNFSRKSTSFCSLQDTTCMAMEFEPTPLSCHFDRRLWLIPKR